MNSTTNVRRPVALALAIGLTLALVAAACGGETTDPAAFCARLDEASGPFGAESVIDPDDPGRYQQTLSELRQIRDVAPEELHDPLGQLIAIFEELPTVPVDDRADYLVEREPQLDAIADSLSSRAFTECGLNIRRAAPTPTPTPEPVVIPPLE